MRRIRKGIVVELEGRGSHGAKLQKLPPAGRKRGSDESSFTRVPLLVTPHMRRKILRRYIQKRKSQ